MLTREWVAVHRKHHAYCETRDDPHSPQIYGIRKVLFEGAELYRAEKDNPHTIEKFGRGAPNDWLEHNVYLRFKYGGIVLMLVADLLFFGVPGITIFAVQMVSMPLFAAGVINGLGHYSGYRNFECDDAARNLVPWAFLIGGTVLIEHLFSYPGIGNLAIAAVINRDLPLIQGLVLTFAVLFILTNLIVDMTYSALNPKVKQG
jgi:fatty-acid desaturase